MIVTKLQFKQWINKVINNSKYGSKWNNIDKAIRDKFQFNDFFVNCHDKVKGDLFEYMCKYVLLQKYQTVYLYDDISSEIKRKHKFRKRDKGIDIIYMDNGKYVGVQCKWRSKINKQIKKCYVTEFMHECKKNKLKDMLFMTNAKKMTNEFDNEAGLKWFLRSDLLETVDLNLINEINNSLQMKKVKRKKFKIKKLRDYQEEGLKQLLANDNKRLKCIMACGTGKTIMMFEYYDRYKRTKKTLFLFPSLQLVSQTYQKFRDLHKNKNTICICSQLDKYDFGGDKLTEEQADERYNEYKNQYGIEYTTDTDKIKERMDTKKIVVFCTYQSCELLDGYKFNLAFFDEAHKTVNSKKFGHLISDKHCKINKRLFFTATPKHYKGEREVELSMDNEKSYGIVGYEYGFPKAIEEKWILDYDITYYTSDPNYLDIMKEKYVGGLKEKNGKEKNIDINDFMSAFMIVKHIQKKENKGKKHHILTYHRTVTKAKLFAKYLRYLFKIKKINGGVHTMSGSNTLSQRKEIIYDFKESDISVICSSRVLNEGVDIPCVNTIVFVDPRRSTIDIIQCVGRGMRLNEGNNKCNVLIPVHYNEMKEDYEFSTIRDILVAIGSVDEKLVEEFCLKDKKWTKDNKERKKYGGNIYEDCDNNGVGGPKYTTEEIENNLYLCVMERNLFAWECKKNLLFEYCNKNKQTPQNKTGYKNVKIAQWLQHQKHYINCEDNTLYKKLAKNEYVKYSLDAYLDPWKKWNERKDLLFEYCDKYKKFPSGKKCVYKNRDIITWLNHQKKKINGIKNDIYKKLSENNYVKEALNRYLDPLKNWNEWRDLLFEYCDKYNKVPTSKIISAKGNLGKWLQSQKKKIKNKNNNLYGKLAKNEYVKESLDTNIEYKKTNNGNIKLKWDEWKKLLFEYCNKNKKIPTRSIKYKDQSIGSWLSSQKNKINDKNNNAYKKLSENIYVKKSLDMYLNPEHKWNERKVLLFEYCDKNKKAPVGTTKYKNQIIGSWFRHTKAKIKSKNDDMYKKLSENIYIKESLDEYLDPWKKWNEWKDLLFEYCNEYNKVIEKCEEYKNHKVGGWFQNQKTKLKGKENDIYKKLSKNKYVKKSLDEFLELKNKNKDKVKLNWDEWKKLLYEYCDKNEKVPPANTKYKNQNINKWLGHQKRKINGKDSEIYKKLSDNKYVKQSLDDYLEYKKTNKNKIKLNWDEWKNLLFEYSNNNQKAPFQKTEYKNQKIGSWLGNQKKKINEKNNDIYKKLSENKYINKNLDEFLIYTEANKDNIKLKWDEWKDLVFEYCDKNKIYPFQKIKYKNHNIGAWFSYEKKKIIDKKNTIYIELSKNDYAKQHLDEYLNPQNEWNKWKDFLFEYCNENKKKPLYNSIHKNKNIGKWLQNQKKKIKNKNNENYKQLSKNKYVKECLDEFLNPSKKWNDRRELLFKFCDEYKKAPTRTIIYKTKRIGSWLHDQKMKIKEKNDDIYKKLSKNIHIKIYIDKYLKHKTINKKNI